MERLRDSFCDYAAEHATFLSSDWLESIPGPDAFVFMENHIAAALLAEIWRNGGFTIDESVVPKDTQESQLLPQQWLSARLAGKGTRITCLPTGDEDSRAYSFFDPDGAQCDVEMTNYIVTFE